MPEVQLRLDSEVALTDSLRRAVWRPKGHRAPIPPNAQQWAPPLPLRRRGSVTTKNPAASVLVDTAGQMSFLLPFLRPPDARGEPPEGACLRSTARAMPEIHSNRMALISRSCRVWVACSTTSVLLMSPLMPWYSRAQRASRPPMFAKAIILCRADVTRSQ